VAADVDVGRVLQPVQEIVIALLAEVLHLDVDHSGLPSLYLLFLPLRLSLLLLQPDLSSFLLFFFQVQFLFLFVEGFKECFLYKLGFLFFDVPLLLGRVHILYS
jgi:hypothetical protein